MANIRTRSFCVGCRFQRPVCRCRVAAKPLVSRATATTNVRRQDNAQSIFQRNLLLVRTTSIIILLYHYYMRLTKLLRCDWLGRNRLIITRAVRHFAINPLCQWSVATTSELFDWQVRYLDMYIFHVYGRVAG